MTFSLELSYFLSQFSTFLPRFVPLTITSLTKAQQANSMVQTSFDSGYGMHSYIGKDGKREALISEVYKKAGTGPPAPLVTVINADSEPVASGGKSGAGAGPGAGGAAFLGQRPIISGAPSPRQLSRQGSSIESKGDNHCYIY